MLIELNDGEDLVVRPKKQGKKAYALICRDDWIGVREFKDIRLPVKRR